MKKEVVGEDVEDVVVVSTLGRGLSMALYFFADLFDGYVLYVVLFSSDGRHTDRAGGKTLNLNLEPRWPRMA